ncbi:MAG: DHA2 family efflux MFS transporter permease subunit [Rhodospirillales bacterium]
MSSGESVEELFRRFGPSYRWLATFTVISGAIIMVLSATIANVAVPHVMGAYGIGQDQAQWMATGFIATMTVSQLMYSWVVQALGVRNTFLTAIGIYVVGTFIGGFAPAFELVVVGRVIQGFASGLIQPLAMVTIFSVFPSDKRSWAMSIYGMGVVIAPNLGPYVGGLAIDLFSWRYIFFLPLPMVLISVVFGLVFLPQEKRVGPLPRLDLVGVALVGLSISLLLSVLANGHRWGWVSNETVSLSAIAVGATVAFIITQLNREDPLLNFGLFRIPEFTSAVIVAFVFGAGNFAITYVIPVFLQTVQGYTATRAGLLVLPTGFALVTVLYFTGRYIPETTQARIPVIIGLLMFAVSAGLVSTADVNTSFGILTFFVIIGRCGLGFIMPFLSSAALKALPPDKLNQGAGTLNFFRQIGGAFGINAVVVVIAYRTQFHSDAMTATQTDDNSSTKELLDQVIRKLQETSLPESQQVSGALEYLDQIIYAQANTSGFQDGIIFITAIFVFAVIPAWILKQKRG